MPLKTVLTAILLLILAACAPAAQPMPTALPPTASPPSQPVSIDYPLDGTVIYAQQVSLSGTSNGVELFRIELINPDNNVIAGETVTPGVDGKWSLQLKHGYTGEPTEITLAARPVNGGDDYDIRTIALAGAQYRPPGTFGTILEPGEGGTAGGDQIPVSGSASGVFENTLTVELSGGGKVISQQNVTLVNPGIVDEVPWTVSLPTNGYTGPAQLVAYTTSPKDGSRVVLGEVKNFTITTEAG
jgi:hypothetical protein